MVRVIANILESYSERDLTIGVLGTHSALEVCRGAKDEGLRTLSYARGVGRGLTRSTTSPGRGSGGVSG